MSETPQAPAADGQRPPPRKPAAGPRRPTLNQEAAINHVVDAMRRDGRKVFAYERLSRVPNARVVALQTPLGHRLLGVVEEFDRAMAAAGRAAVKLFDEGQRNQLRKAEDEAARATQQIAEAATALIISSGATFDRILDPIVKTLVRERKAAAGEEKKPAKAARARAPRAAKGEGAAPPATEGAPSAAPADDEGEQS